VFALALAACGGEPPVQEPTDAPAEIAAEAPPGTDIWLASLGLGADGQLEVGTPANVTNRAGYDNQPYFLADGSGVWYTVIDEAGVADIWLHDLAAGTNSAVTTTAPESEYSATSIPGGGFSAIRVESDSTQRLWRFDADGENASVLMPDLAPVGYHAWGEDGMLVMFVLGQPATLQVGNANSGEAEVVGERIGRSIQRIPGSSRISFVQRVSQEESWISRIDPATGEQERLIEAIEGGDFHAWTPDGTLIMAHGSRLYAWTPGAEGDWDEIADLTDVGIEITRLAVSPDGSKIAIVGEASD
jgi:Tol biopolymer transport system component